MDVCDVLIVGGGPGGSSCAWRLRQNGLSVSVLDKASFPRDKPCAGWVTPEVITDLDIDAADYQQGRVLQPITGFRVSVIGGPEVEVRYGRTVSYGVRRCEFDTYLLNRSRARVVSQTAATRIERVGENWVVNGQFQAPVLVGAGGHFCPVAKLLGANASQEASVVAQEIEFGGGAALDGSEEIPELYFCRDLKGYGWCVRKNGYVNIGLGRLDHHHLSEHVASFLTFLKAAGRLDREPSQRFCGHAYLVRQFSTRRAGAPGVLLVGDAAGVAYSRSGEGIYPAVRSGLAAAETIVASRGNLGQQAIDSYRGSLARLNDSAGMRLPLPPALAAWIGRALMRSRPFVRHVVLDKWFLHAA